MLAPHSSTSYQDGNTDQHVMISPCTTFEEINWLWDIKTENNFQDELDSLLVQRAARVDYLYKLNSHEMADPYYNTYHEPIGFKLLARSTRATYA